MGSFCCLGCLLWHAQQVPRVYCEFESEVCFMKQTFLQLEILQGENDLISNHLISFLKFTGLDECLEASSAAILVLSGFSFMRVAKKKFLNCCLQGLQDSETSPTLKLHLHSNIHTFTKHLNPANMPKLASFGWKQDKSGSNRTWIFHNLFRDRSTTHLFVHNVRVLKFAFELVNTHTDTVHAVHWTDGFLECLPFHFLYNDSSGCLESHEGMVERRHRPSLREAATDHVKKAGR
ncbi:hypothetical protein CAPTEDRAFT_189944 [Capitella teleta]|uniref:Uncharacterized protein n=1 Tax=Capitella teleta TaxID=283909 RepID=R7VEI2_CAPTE|nr:hypothetical protein CAPTEDRAFT_189944 [Capitella teleta]|eukprot:ELU17049.1 hypothetical protein CAPTEDRAFT_189944 [Capitella teleta]